VTRVIIASMWSHVEVVGVVDDAAPPTTDQLDAIATARTAANCGVVPVVRVLEQLALPACVDYPEPVCEEEATQPRSW
jgi:hypothetical protein